MAEPLQNMALFRELMRCGSYIYTWCFDAEGHLLESNCPEEELFSFAFSILGCKDRMMTYWQEHSNPVTLGSGLGLIWGAAFEKKDGEPYRAWVIGPSFYTDVGLDSIRQGFQTYFGVEVSIEWKHQFIEALYHVPTQPYTVHSRNLLMLHYCVTGEHLTISDLETSLADTSPNLQSVPVKNDRYRVWAAETALLQMVRSGDLDYKHALNNSQALSNGTQVRGKDPLQQGRISGIVFCSIVCRAAIEGGLSPEEGYALGDAYIQNLVDAHSVDELISIPLTMYDDFIHRVHKLRTNPKLSIPVHKCVDYIEMNLHKRIRATDLAAIAGYGEYYLTRKFKEETGLSVNNYIKFAKIGRAKVLLKSTDLSIQSIANSLGFATRSHFSESFRQVTEMSPVDYRDQNKNKNI